MSRVCWAAKTPSGAGIALLSIIMLLTAALVSAHPQARTEIGRDKPSASGDASRLADFAQEPVVYESVETSMRYENDGSGLRETKARIHVQTDAGLREAGQLIFSYNAENEAVEIRSVRVIKPDGTSIATGAENIQDLSSPVAQFAPIYSDARQRHVTVSGLSIGDTLEYDIAIAAKPLEPGQFWHTHQFVSTAICLDEQLELNVPKDRALKLKSSEGLTADVHEQGDRRIYHWKRSNLAVPKPIEFLPSFKIDVRQLLEGPRPTPPPHIAFSTFQSWADVGNWYAKLERDRREPTDAVRAQVRQIVRTEMNETEKAEALYGWVTRNIRYVSLSFGIGRYQPHPAGDVLRNRYGDCKDKTTLLEAFLAVEGIHARPALMNLSAPLELDVPTPLAFDHAITVASVGGRDVWLDPTLGVVSFGYLLPQLRGQNALVATATPDSGIQKTPEALAIPTVYKLEVKGEVNGEGNLDGTVKFTLRGDLEVLLRLLNSALPPAQFSSLVQEALTKTNRLSYGGTSFTDFRLEDASDISKPLLGQFHFVGNLAFLNLRATTPEAFLKSADLALAKNVRINWPGASDVASASESQKPVDEIDAPKEYSLSAAITVPSVTLNGAEKPFDSRITSRVGDYDSTATWDGQTLRAEWRMTMHSANAPIYTAEDYAKFREDILHVLIPPEKQPEIRAATTITLTRSGNSLNAAERKAAPSSDSAAAIASPASASPHSPPATAEALYKQGQTEDKLTNYANAVQIYQSALKIDPEYAIAWRELGRSYMYLRDYPDAEAAFRKYLALSPDDHLAYLNMAWVLYDEKKYAEDADLMQKRIADAPGDGGAYTQLGAAYLALNQADRAVPELERAVEIFPKYQFARFSLGRAYLKTQQDSKAVSAFQAAIDINPTGATLNSAAYALAEGKVSLDVAEKWARQAITEVETESNQTTLETQNSRLSALADRLAMYWDTLGWIKFEQSDYQAAEKYVFGAWQMRNDSTIGSHLGQIYAAQGRKEDAAEAFAELTGNLPPKHEMSKDEQDASEQLAALRNNGNMKEDLLASAHERLRSVRMVKIDNTAKVQGISQYLLLIGPGAKILDMETVGSDTGLDTLADSMRSTLMPQSFPDALIQKIPRVGTLACISPEQSCTLTLASTSSASRVLPSSDIN